MSFKSILKVAGPDKAYKALDQFANQTLHDSQTSGFSQVLHTTLNDVAQSIHTNEADMKKFTLGLGGDIPQLTFSTAEIANKVKVVSSVVQRTASVWNDLTKMQI